VCRLLVPAAFEPCFGRYVAALADPLAAVRRSIAKRLQEA